MYNKLKKSREGFTIIEVMIVLAIAGLIMLIVFLAVPALQRGQRNNARNSDASRVLATALECKSVKNDKDACSAASGISSMVGDLSQLEVFVDSNALAHVTEAVNIYNGAESDKAVVFWDRKCDLNGASIEATFPESSGSTVVVYSGETGGGYELRCVQG